MERCNDGCLYDSLYFQISFKFQCEINLVRKITEPSKLALKIGKHFFVIS